MLNLLQEVKGANRIGITGHLRPDGDCVGSTMALYLYLSKKMPEANITVYLEETAKAYHHIAQVEKIDTTFQAKEESAADRKGPLRSQLHSDGHTPRRDGRCHPIRQLL